MHLAYLINCQVIAWEAVMICYVKMIGSEKLENKQQKIPDSLVSQRELTVPSEVLLITFNLSLKQRMMEFALKCEVKPPGHANNRRQLHLFTEQKKTPCLLSSLQQTACHWCKDTEGSGTEQGNQKESTAVIKMSHECTITGNL